MVSYTQNLFLKDNAMTERALDFYFRGLGLLIINSWKFKILKHSETKNKWNLKNKDEFLLTIFSGMLSSFP